MRMLAISGFGPDTIQRQRASRGADRGNRSNRLKATWNTVHLPFLYIEGSVAIFWRNVNVKPIKDFREKEEAMNEKEKYSAEIEARIAEFDETLNEIETKRELRNESRPEVQIDATIRKHQEAQAKVKALKESDSGAWETIKTEVDGLLDDIDKELKEALAYFG
jgi:hypothetical protein